MNDVVERVARAMFDAAMAERYADFPERAPQWPPSMHEIRHEWDRSARAAIEAMLTPSPKMVAAGIKALADAYWDDVAESDVTACWSGMLSAALADASPDIGKEGIGDDVR